MSDEFSNGSHLKVVQGGKAEAMKSAKALTHKDIKEFLAKFAEAILVDQKRVNKLPRKKLHPEYDPGMWKRNREDHVGAIIELCLTVDAMPKRLLADLTKFAIAYKPELVRRSFLDNISDLATKVSSPWLYETASLFFSQLIKDVSRKEPGIFSSDDPPKRMSMWFNYDDPIQIAHDPECQYVGLLASHIKQESQKTKQALATQCRLSFIETRVAHEFVDYLRPDILLE